MTERKAAVTFQGMPLTLTGNEVKVGDKIPAITLVDNDMKELSLASFKGKPFLLLSVPSLDTAVCSKESARFNKEISGEDIVAVVVSMDLPFAQKRWCGQERATSIKTLSDYRAAEFGNKMGVLIKELHLLARAAFVVDGTGTIRYFHLVKEITQEPPYEEILKAIKAEKISK